MRPPARKWEQRSTRYLPQAKSRHRDWPVLRRLTVVTVALLLASLPAEFWLGSRALVMACYVGSGIAGAVLLAYLFNKRLRVERPPT